MSQRKIQNRGCDAMDVSELRIAIVHDWLVAYAGSERVVEQMLQVYPNADLFSLVCAMPGEPPRSFRGRPVVTSFIQRLPFGVSRFRAWLPLMPFAVEQFDLSSYDLVISSSHCVAKGVLTGPDQCHVCYCYSPVRYAWDLQHQYLTQSRSLGIRGWPARWILHKLRQWDVRTGNGVDRFLTLSGYIARRIRKCYGRSSTVIYPPVDVAGFPMGSGPRNGFVAASRMVPYKQMPLIVQAFAGLPDMPLTVIGDGPDLAACRAAAVGHPHIKILGYQPTKILRETFAASEAFIFAAEEDFGIAPLEAQASGTPVIAFGRGGASETIINGTTGLFFHRQDVTAIQETVKQFRSMSPMRPEACRANAERFAPEHFRSQFAAAVEDAWNEHQLRCTTSVHVSMNAK